MAKSLSIIERAKMLIAAERAVQKSALKAQSKALIDPQRMAFPGIWGNPAEIAAEAASRVAPESPNLKRLFGVTRGDLYEMGKEMRGNLPGALPGASANPRGSLAADRIMTPKNVQRILDVNAEAMNHPELVQGMDPWYVMTPYYKRMVELLGPEKAAAEYHLQNTLMGMASPGSEVTTEIPRGSAAYFLQNQGRFQEFVDHMGIPQEKREAAGVAPDIIGVPGHMYHPTAQAKPMQKFLETGQLDMSSPKVPMYIEASGVPETGFQTQTPVGDAHWSRAVGLADTRGVKTIKGKEATPGQSVSNPEMQQLAPWWRDKIAAQLGIESVPAQARTWGAFSGQTGVTTPIGSPKLELIADQIANTAERLGVSPETARDMVMTGEARMGFKDGGVVDGTLEDMVKDPQAEEMLNLDLMKLAAMPQMASGGVVHMAEAGLVKKVIKAAANSFKVSADHPSIPKDWFRGQLGAKATEGAFESTAGGRAPSFADRPEVASHYAMNPNAGHLYGEFGEIPADAAEGANVSKHQVTGQLFDIRHEQGAHGTKTGLSQKSVERALEALGLHPNQVDLEPMYSTKFGRGKNATYDVADGEVPASRRVLPGYVLFDDPSVQQALQENGFSGALFHGAMSDPMKFDTSVPWDESVVHTELRGVDPKSLKTGYAGGGVVHMAIGGSPQNTIDQAVLDSMRYDLENQPYLKPTTDVNEQINNARLMADRAMQPNQPRTQDVDYHDSFSVHGKPTGQPSVPVVSPTGGFMPSQDQMRYELTKDNSNYTDKVEGVVQAAGTLGSNMWRGMVAPFVGAAHGYADWMKGDAATPAQGAVKPATEFMEGAYKPTHPKAFEYLGDVSDAVDWAGRELGHPRIPEMIPELLPLQQIPTELMRLQLLEGAVKAANGVGKVAKGAGKAVKVADAMYNRAYDAGLIPQPGMSIKDVTPKDNTIRLYHGSPDEKLTEVNEKGLFGGVFGSPNKQAAESHGEHLHYADISKDKILSHYDLNYELPYEKVNEALLKERPDLRDNPELHEKVWNTVINDRGQTTHNLSDSDLMEMFHTSDAAEAGFDAQKLRGKISKNLGYHAVELEDEHGTSYLINPGTKLNKNGVAIEQPKATPAKPEKVLAPVNEMGMYSPIEQAAIDLQRKKGPGTAFISDLLKGEEVTKEKMDDIGLTDWLKNKPNVTADEVREYVQSSGVKLNQTKFGGDQEEFKALLKKHDLDYDEGSFFRKNGDEVDYDEVPHDLLMKMPNEDGSDGVRHEKWSTPGGKNYREVVMHLPQNMRGAYATEIEQINKKLAEKGYDGLDSEQIQVLKKGGQQAKGMLDDFEARLGVDTGYIKEGMFGYDPNAYYHPHWEEVGNPLAHIRMQDFVDVDGKKTLLVDEVQSDWHQAARDARNEEIKSYMAHGMSREEASKKVPEDFGFQKPETARLKGSVLPDEDSYFKDGYKVQWADGTFSGGLNKESAERLAEKGKSNERTGLPNAPYKSSWYQLALKRAIKEAIDGGHDRVALPSGERVAERFDLSKQVESIYYKKNADGKYWVDVKANGRDMDLPKNEYSASELPGLVGREIADRITNGDGKPNGSGFSLSGFDLKIGGEGMKKWYDEIYPNYLKKFAKKHGAATGETRVPVAPKDSSMVSGYPGGQDYMSGKITWDEFLKKNPRAKDEFSDKVFYMDITPKMREAYKHGMPMKKGGKVSFASTPEQMRQELLRQG